ncbi:Potassium channel protein [hydrothermal vent metagenome]|uniref:Potassium channel protein n=1 Tax=hydrothermal vent metagenome TaxID=652676 RepID=A0A1W1D161_9ZZZZ
MRDNAFWIILQRLRVPLIVIIVTYAIAILGMVLIPGLDDKGDVYHLSFFDAFYFISYTASTIGFGETPYDFTYPQRLWVVICIYLTAIGWFYTISAVISIISDKTLKSEIIKGRFIKQVQQLKSDFIIILGYNRVHAEIIKRLRKADIGVVLVDYNLEIINLFQLEESSTGVPVMVEDALLTSTLKDAGLNSPYCKAVVAHFYKEDKNLRITVLTRFLNPNVKVITKATLHDTMIAILDTDIAKVENPFDIFAKRFDIALTAPHILTLENWIYKNSDLADEASFLPQGRYIICGYGRLGKVIKEKLDKHGMDYVIIDEKGIGSREMIKNETFIRANADDKDVLLDVGIESASVLVAGTQNDIDNISILITAKKLNPDLYVIARENTMKEISIFEATNANWLFMIEKILINKTSLQISQPLKHSFLKKVLYKDEEWGTSLVNLLKAQLGNNPQLLTLTINEEKAFAIYHVLKGNKPIGLNILLKSLANWQNYHKAIPLFLKRNKDEFVLPSNELLEIGDQILFACDADSREEIELIASNIYDLHYVQTGEEKRNWLLSKVISLL